MTAVSDPVVKERETTRADWHVAQADYWAGVAPTYDSLYKTLGLNSKSTGTQRTAASSSGKVSKKRVEQLGSGVRLTASHGRGDTR